MAAERRDWLTDSPSADMGKEDDFLIPVSADGVSFTDIWNLAGVGEGAVGSRCLSCHRSPSWGSGEKCGPKLLI